MFIRQLKYLVALAEIGHFSRAAELCHVSQPALSTAIRNLEKELELSLVRRGRNYEGLTAEGERVVGWAQQLLSSYDAMRQETVSAHKNLSGTLRIGAIPTAVPIAPCLSREIGFVIRQQDPYPPLTAAALEMALKVPLQARFDSLIAA
jgi:DNA-binding transcriptional LysR family regulator